MKTELRLPGGTSCYPGQDMLLCNVIMESISIPVDIHRKVVKQREHAVRMTPTRGWHRCVRVLGAPQWWPHIPQAASAALSYGYQGAGPGGGDVRWYKFIVV